MSVVVTREFRFAAKRTKEKSRDTRVAVVFMTLRCWTGENKHCLADKRGTSSRHMANTAPLFVEGSRAAGNTRKPEHKRNGLDCPAQPCSLGKSKAHDRAATCPAPRIPPGLCARPAWKGRMQCRSQTRVGCRFRLRHDQ
jgi:hypothetical protein